MNDAVVSKDGDAVAFLDAELLAQEICQAAGAGIELGVGKRIARSEVEDGFRLGVRRARCLADQRRA
jgi:hypothetical protein